MPTLSVRKPNYITITSVTLKVELFLYNPGATAPTEPTYILTKNSYEDGVDDYLSINISSYIRDFINSQLVTIGSTIVLDTNSMVQCDVKINDGATVTYDCYDGYEDITVPRIHTASVKNLVPGEEQFFSVHESIDYLKWEADNGSSIDTNTHPFPTNTYDQPYLAKAVPGGFSLTNATKLTITARKVGAIQWVMTYNVTCGFEANTYAFINRWGAWESFTAIGSKTELVNTERENYKQFSTAIDKQYFVNGEEAFTNNTGYVDTNFRDVIQDFYLSEVTLTYSQYQPNEEMILTGGNIPVPHPRIAKMLDYTLNYKMAEKIIPLV